MTLNGQRVLVCGGTSGIGAATARLFARQGADAAVTGRDAERLAKAAADGLTARRLDAASAREVAAFFAEDTVYDHLVLALGGGAGMGPIATLGLDGLRAGFEGKFWPHLRLLQAALPRMAAGGSVTFVTAASARVAMPGVAGLAAVNGALEGMVPTLALELAPLRVNAVSPGVIETPWWDGMPADQRAAAFAEYAAALPVGRVGRAEDVAQAILLTATNGFVTGSVVDCDGGLGLATRR